MKRTMLRTLRATTLVTLAACAGPDGAPDGTGSQLGTSQIVERADFGHVSFTQIDVPEVIKASYPQTKSITVTNNTAQNWGPFGMRFTLSKRCVGEVNGYLNHVDKDFVSCTNTCATANNGTCDDAWPGPHDGACQPGTDCADCGARGTDWACGEAPSRSCQANEYCEPESNTCHPELITIGNALVRGLDAGASTTVQYELALPPGWTTVDEFTFVVLFDEEPLMLSGEDIVSDPDVPDPLPGMTPFHLASAVYVHQTEVSTEVDPPDIDATVTLATNMLELDDTMMATRAALVATVSLTSLGMPVNENTFVTWKLKLPGHTLDRANYDAEQPTGAYDPERTFTLKAGVGDFKLGADVIIPTGGKPGIPQGVYVDRTGGNDAREGTTADRVYALHLHSTDVGVLSETLKLRAQNPDLNGNDEIEGTLLTEVATTYKGQWIRETFETPVIFKAPEVVFEDAPTNTIPKVAKPLDLTTSAAEPINPFEEVLEEYPEVDHITPTWYKDYGGAWLGAEAQVRNFTSKGRYQDAVVRQNFIADNFLRIFLFNFRDDNGNPRPFPLLEIAAHVDLGTLGRESLQENIANAMVRVPATGIMFPGPLDVMVNGGSIFDLLSNVLLDVDFADSECDTEGNLEVCQVITKGDDEPPDYLLGDGDEGYNEEPDEEGDPSVGDDDEDEEEDSNFGVNLDPGEISVEYTLEKEKRMCKGPFCVIGKASASAVLGVRNTLGFFREEYPNSDPLEQPEVFQGIQASMGPFVEVSAQASGTLSMMIAGVSLIGNINFLEAELVPTLRVGLAQELKTQGVPEDCWRKNTGRVQFLGPASLTVMWGDVVLEAWAGLLIPTPFGDIDLRHKIFEFTLYEFPPLGDYEWELWNESVDFRREGLCPGLDTAGLRWATPVGCKSVSGEDSYCPKGTGGDGYDIRKNYAKRLYTGPSQCGRIIIDGNLEPHGFDADLATLIGDYVHLETGPTVDANGTTPLTNTTEKCARYDRTGKIFARDGGTVVCGQFDSDDAQHVTTPHHWKYSGEFNRFTLDFCKDDPAEYLRWVNVKLISDDILNTKGLAVRLEPREGIETNVYSKAGWESTSLVSPWSGHPEILNFGHNKDYFAAQKVANLTSRTMGGTPFVAAAPFTAQDAAQTEWIWAQYTPREGTNHAQDFARFRRPFLAASDEYDIRVYCAPGLECMASISPPEPALGLFTDGGRPIHASVDGKALSSTPEGNKVRTRRGEPHVLYIEARNLRTIEDPWFGVAVMMKPVE